MTSETEKELLLRVADGLEIRPLGWAARLPLLTAAEARTISRVLREAASSSPAPELDAYDAGLLSDYGGGNVEWWQDYIRAELGRAHDHYAVQVENLPVLREAAEGPATPDLDAVLNATMNEMCRSGRVAIVTDAEMRAPEPAEGWRPIPVTPEIVRYVSRYGGDCRDCADNTRFEPICSSGLPCDADKAIEHVLKAINYGFSNGFLKFPPPPATETTKTEETRHD